MIATQADSNSVLATGASSERRASGGCISATDSTRCVTAAWCRAFWG